MGAIHEGRANPHTARPADHARGAGLLAARCGTAMTIKGTNDAMTDPDLPALNPDYLEQVDLAQLEPQPRVEHPPRILLLYLRPHCDRCADCNFSRKR